MTIVATCTACSREYRLKDEMAGRTFSCKDCGEKVRVGSGAASASTKPAGGRRSREAESDPRSEPLPPRRRTSGSSGNPGASRRAASAGKSSKAPLYIGIGVGVAALIVAAVMFFPKRDSSNSVVESSSPSPQATATGDAGSTGDAASGVPANSAAAGGDVANADAATSVATNGVAVPGITSNGVAAGGDAAPAVASSGVPANGVAAGPNDSSTVASSAPGGFSLDPDPVSISWDKLPKIKLAAGSDFDHPLAGTSIVAVRDLIGGAYTSTSWDLATGKAVGQIKGLAISAGERGISPDGLIMAVLDGPRKNVQIWSFAAGKMTLTIPVEQGTAIVNNMACLSSSRVLTYTLTQNGTSFVKQLKLYDATTGQLLKSQNLEDSINLNSLAVSFGGKYFASSEMNKGTTIYRSETLEAAATLPMPTRPYATPSGAAFNAAGDQISVVWTDLTTTVISTTKLADGSVKEISIPGRLTLSPITGQTYSGPAIEWLPDGTGWLLFGRTIVDAESQQRVWTIDTDGLNGTRRRLLLPEGQLVYTGGANLETMKITNPGLKLIKWPKADAAKSIAALAAGGDAKLKPGSVVTLKVEIGQLKYGMPEETRARLEEAFQERLVADGMVSTGDPEAVLSVSYSEADGKEMFSQGRRLPGVPAPPTPPAAGTAIQSTVASIKLALQITGETKPVWSADLLINPSVLMIRGDATAESARNAMFETAQWQITSAPIPYYVPLDAALPMLPGQTIYSSE